MSVTLYPELVDYIFDYSSKFFTEKEKKAQLHYLYMQKTSNRTNNLVKFINKSGHLSSDSGVLELLADGYQVFKERIAERIFSQHLQNIDLNLCPACGKIARTQLAKQCRFCFCNWH